MKHYLITLAAVLCLMATARGGETAGSATCHLKLDTSTGVRTAVLGVPETLTFTTNYPGGAVAGATVEITVNGAELVTTNGTGTVEWTPTRSGTNELHHIVKAGETVIANLVARFLLPTVEVTPTNLPHVTSHVYTNGVEVALSGEPPAYSVVSNQENTVIIYTTDDYYVFPGGDTAYTNRVDTGNDPAGLMPGETPPPVPQHEARAVRYLAPVYVGGDAKGGVASWTTNEVAVGAYDVVESSPSAVTWGAPGGESWYVVAGLDIRISGGVTCQGAVNLILRPGARLTVAHVADGKAGIATGAAGSFAAYGQPEGEGELAVTGGAGAAAIGGGKGEDGSRITINGGVIHALAHGLGPTTNDLCGSVGIGGVTCSNVLFRGGCTLAEGWSEEGLGIGGTSSATGIVAAVDRMVQVGEGSWPDEIVAHGEGEDLAPKLAAKRVALIGDGEVTTIGTAPDEVEHTTTTVYTNGVASADGTAWLNGDATVTYVCDEGWVFVDGTSEKTYRLDTRYDPATIINGEHPPEVVPGVGLTGVAARTRYPWNGLVDIDYTLRSNLPAGYTLTVMAFGGIETCEATAVAFAPDATAAGAHTLTWDMNADGFCDVAKGVVFRVAAKKAPGAAGVSVMDSSDPVALDLRTGKVRQVAFGETETLTFTTNYPGGAVAGATVEITVNGAELVTTNGTGAIEWTPTVLGTNTLEHTVYAADGVTVVTNFVARFYYDYMVEVRPHPQDHTTANVYVGGEPVPQTAGKYSVVSNETVDVVFRADAGYHFEGKANAKTNTIEATKSVNEVAGPAVAFVTLDLTDPSKAQHTLALYYEWVTSETGKANIPAQEAALNVLQANGQMKWQNLILGLDGTQATARPVCEVVATSDEENVTFRLGGVNVATDSGATVTYMAWLGSAPGGRDLGESEEKAYDELLSQPLPPAKGVSVLYYLLETFIR